MPHRPVIDALEFARAGASLRGTWPVADFPRLRDALTADAGAVEYELHGERDSRGRPALRVRVRGTLQLSCQRCLEAMELPLDIDSTLVLAVSQAEIDAELLSSDSADRLIARKSLPVGELLEDELLLAVPYAPRHARCRARGAPGGETGDSGASPFAHLHALLGRGRSGRARRGGKR